MTEREREALMRLTMCARNECVMCKYKDSCDSDVRFEFATKHMNILAEADRKTENSSEKPNNCEDFFREPTAEERKAVADYIDSISVPTGVNVFDLMDDPTSSKMEQVEDEPKTQMKTQNSNLTFEKADEQQKWEAPPKFERKEIITTCVSVPAFLIKDALVEDEPQTDCPWK